MESSTSNWDHLVEFEPNQEIVSIGKRGSSLNFFFHLKISASKRGLARLQGMALCVDDGRREWRNTKGILHFPQGWMDWRDGRGWDGDFINRFQWW